MKKVILSFVGLIALVSMSFTRSNSNKIMDIKKETALDFKKDFNASDFSNLKGAKKAIVVGTSATAFPGTLNDSWSTISGIEDGSKELNVKMNNVINKY